MNIAIEIDFGSKDKFVIAIKQNDKIIPLELYCDDKRHLVCKPYSLDYLHFMAAALNIKRCWFHKDHFDIPKRRINEIKNYCNVVNSKTIVQIINAAA